MTHRSPIWQPSKWAYVASTALGAAMGAVLWLQPSAAHLLLDLPRGMPESILHPETLMAMGAGGIFGIGYCWLALRTIPRPAKLTWVYPLLLIGTPLVLGLAAAVSFFIGVVADPTADVDWGLSLSMLIVFTVWPLRVTAPLGVVSGLIAYALAKLREARSSTGGAPE